MSTNNEPIFTKDEEEELLRMFNRPSTNVNKTNNTNTPNEYLDRVSNNINGRPYAEQVAIVQATNKRTLPNINPSKGPNPEFYPIIRDASVNHPKTPQRNTQKIQPPNRTDRTVGGISHKDSLQTQLQKFKEEARVGVVTALICALSGMSAAMFMSNDDWAKVFGSAAVFGTSILVSKIIDKIKLTFSQVTNENISYMNVKDIIAKLGLLPQDHKMIYLLYQAMKPKQFQELLAELGFNNKELYFKNRLEKNKFDMSSLPKETLWGRSPVEQAYGDLYLQKINLFANKIKNGKKSKETLNQNEKRLLELLENLNSNMVKPKGRH